MDKKTILISIITINITLIIINLGRFIFTPEIMVFLLPLLIVLSFSPIGKAISRLIHNDTESNNQLIDKITYLENRVKEQENELSKIREVLVFNDNKLLK